MSISTVAKMRGGRGRRWPSRLEEVFTRDPAVVLVRACIADPAIIREEKAAWPVRKAGCGQRERAWVRFAIRASVAKPANYGPVTRLAAARRKDSDAGTRVNRTRLPVIPFSNVEACHGLPTAPLGRICSSHSEARLILTSKLRLARDDLDAEDEDGSRLLGIDDRRLIQALGWFSIALGAARSSRRGR